MYDVRKKMIEMGEGVDWVIVEVFVFVILLVEGILLLFIYSCLNFFYCCFELKLFFVNIRNLMKWILVMKFVKF